MKTQIVNDIANEAIYQLPYYKNLCLAHKKINKILFKHFITIIICLIAFHVFYHLKFLVNLSVELFL